MDLLRKVNIMICMSDLPIFEKILVETETMKNPFKVILRLEDLNKFRLIEKPTSKTLEIENQQH